MGIDWSSTRAAATAERARCNGWRDLSYNRKSTGQTITFWDYSILDRTLAIVEGLPGRYRIEVQGLPDHPPLKPYERTMETYGLTIDEAKLEAEILLRRIGHVIDGHVAPVQDHVHPGEHNAHQSP